MKRRLFPCSMAPGPWPPPWRSPRRVRRSGFACRNDSPDDAPMTGESPEEERNKKNLVGVLAALVVLALIVWLVHALHKNMQMEKCLEEGRRDCVDLPQPEN